MWIWTANKSAKFHAKRLNRSENIPKSSTGVYFFSETPCRSGVGQGSSPVKDQRSTTAPRNQPCSLTTLVLGMAALFYSPVDFTDASDLHQTVVKFIGESIDSTGVEDRCTKLLPIATIYPVKQRLSEQQSYDMPMYNK